MKARAFWIPGVLGVFIGCNNGGGGSDCQAGTPYCPCLNGICQIGLECISNFCLAPDDETSGDGDPGDGDPGDGDGDQGDGDADQGDGDGDGNTDSDDDGIVDANDNCSDVPNPNQLDFDENGVGNVCDTLVFSDVSGVLSSELAIDADFAGACQVSVDLLVTSGTVQVRLDDDATVASFEIVELTVADFGDSCTTPARSRATRTPVIRWTCRAPSTPPSTASRMHPSTSRLQPSSPNSP
jgi:hypothetical protein